MSQRPGLLRGMASCTAAAMAIAVMTMLADGSSARSQETGMKADRCILCRGSFADKAPRICTSCDNKHRNKCILCGGSFAEKLPRICTSCDSKYRNKCILCGGSFAEKAPRICTSCSNKF